MHSVLRPLLPLLLRPGDLRDCQPLAVPSLHQLPLWLDGVRLQVFQRLPRPLQLAGRPADLHSPGGDPRQGGVPGGAGPRAGAPQ